MNILWSDTHIQHIEAAKKAIAEAKTEKAIEKLKAIQSSELQNIVTVLETRLNQFTRENLGGTLTFEQQNVQLSRINKDTLTLISSLQQNQTEGAEYVEKIKTYLKERYTNRLDQKLAYRQPVNLRKLPSTIGTSTDTSAAFIAYDNEEIRDEITKIFKDSHGRLLIIGAPGSGKTTLLLELELKLLEIEKNTLPIVLNLATWQAEFKTLEEWLERILPAELGVSKALAKKVVNEYPLILLLDGFDEIKEEERTACLDSIGKYGADAKRQFVITSRIEEYKAVTKDAPVHTQIEVGPLTIEQIENELQQIGHSQPEAPHLLQAIKTDTILREAVKIPFYFNTLQLLFANGKRLNDLNFKAFTIEGRQKEIKERFIELVSTQPKYNTDDIKKWLSFFAFEMNRHNLVEFELLDLQYSWLYKLKNYLILPNLTKGLVEGLFRSLYVSFFYLIFWWILANLLFYRYNIPVVSIFPTLTIIPFVIIFYVLFLMIVHVLRYNLNKNLFVGIKTKDSISLSLKNIKKGFFKAILIAIIVTLPASVAISILDIFSSFSIFPLLYNISLLPLNIIAIIMYSLTLTPLYSVIDSLENSYSFIQINKPYQRFQASAKFFYFSILQHFLLRRQLRKKGLLPYKLVHFLNDMTKNHLMESDGATWRFRHRILQDYFAEQWENRLSDEVQK